MPALYVFLAILALAAVCEGGVMQSAKAEYYTQNAICLQNNCVNPVFPGLDDLPQLEKLAWQCTNHSMVADYMDFCKEAVNYDPSLPSPNSTSQPINVLVKQQDDAAATMFFYHLNGLGYEPMEFRHPARSDDICVKSIWNFVCYTYFPRAQAGCKKGEASPYMKPCKNVCSHYVDSCAVECCDESVACVFSRSVDEPGTDNTVVLTGYEDRVGPSALCTGSDAHGRKAPIALLLGLLAMHVATLDIGGGSRGAAAGPRRQRRSRSGLLATAVLAVAIFTFVLQGCEVDLPHHSVGNWEAQPNYLAAYEYIPPGKRPTAAVLNSCSVKNLPPEQECSGRGYCKEFSPNSVVQKDAVSFCECDRNWADPECRTRRLSQVKLYLLSLFGGFLGLDYFYLDYPFYGLCKLLTVGGGGIWWLIDVVRTGSGPVYGYKYRVAADLPHWVFVLSVVTIFGFAGLAVGVESYLSHRKQKRDDIMKLQESEEARQLGKMEEIDGPRYKVQTSGMFDGRRAFHGYGATFAGPPQPYGGAPAAGPQVASWTHNESL